MRFSTRPSLCNPLFLGPLLLVLATGARADAPAAPASGEAPAAAIERLKAEGAALRAQADARYQAAEPECYKRFQVNKCLNDAKQERIATVHKARKLEAEARRLDLAERQRRSQEAMEHAAEESQSHAVTSPAAPPPPAPDAERIRAERAADAERAEEAAGKARAEKDAAKAAERARLEADAAKRARQAAEDRARYDARIKKREEERAADGK